MPKGRGFHAATSMTGVTAPSPSPRPGALFAKPLEAIIAWRGELNTALDQTDDPQGWAPIDGVTFVGATTHTRSGGIVLVLGREEGVELPPGALIEAASSSPEVRWRVMWQSPRSGEPGRVSPPLASAEEAVLTALCNDTPTAGDTDTTSGGDDE